MNPEMKSEIQRYVAKWRPRLRLMDWSIAFTWDDADTRVSQCFTEERYRRANLHFAPDFPALKKDDVPGVWLTLEKLVLHELSHIVTTHLHIAGRAVLGVANVAKAVEEQGYDRLDHANEFTTEWIARLLWEAYEGSAWDEVIQPPSASKTSP